ncbi:MAG TPA: hypothetical protein DDZ76_04465 [Xanthomonadales bacterium]|nr:hypothetical protein [Xanthomonadales bacterium]
MGRRQGTPARRTVMGGTGARVESVGVAVPAVARFALDGAQCWVFEESSGPTAGSTSLAANGSIRTGMRRVGEFVLGDRRYGLYAANRSEDAPVDPMVCLTQREQQIVRLVCLGCVNKQIADRLRISEYTVRTYLKQIFVKLDVHSRAAMVFKCAAGCPGMPG